jgi:alcohol dehydrogenase (cytochrome c)
MSAGVGSAHDDSTDTICSGSTAGEAIMSILRRTHATACMMFLFTLSGFSASRAADADADWLTYNRTLAGDRFSPLKEMDRSNVAQLKAICTYALPEVSSLQTGPLVIDGAMYFTTDEGSYAIDASTCAEKWKQHRHSDTPSMLLVNRGFA